MDAGVVLRDRRLKTRTGCMFACVRASAKGGGRSPHTGLQPGNLGRGAKRAACLGNNWLTGDCELPQMPSVAFGVAVHWRSWQTRSRRQPIIVLRAV